MREKIKTEIEKSLGNGKIKIILGAYSKKMTKFLDSELNSVSSNIFRVEEGFPDNYLFEHLTSNIKASNRRVFLINKITNYSEIDAIINLFAGKKDADLIASSNVLLESLLDERSTLVRGRIQYIVFPPFLCDDLAIRSSLSDFLEDIGKIDEDLFEGISNFKYIEEIKRIYKALLVYIGYPMDLTGLYGHSNINVSPNTFVSIFNYMLNRGFLYGVQKFNLKDKRIMPNYLYCYPTDISYIYKNASKKDDRWVRKIFETAIISKLRNDGSLLYKAVYRNSETKDDSGLLHTFVVMAKDKHYLLKLYFDNNEKSLKQFCKQKYPLQKVVLITDDIDTFVDDDGVIYAGLKQFLRKGI